MGRSIVVRVSYRTVLLAFFICPSPPSGLSMLLAGRSGDGMDRPQRGSDDAPTGLPPGCAMSKNTKMGPVGVLVAGTLAGAAGTIALNGLTYLDMALRGRPAS